MTPAPDADYLSRFSEALVSEIKAEMGRRDLSARGLAALIGVNPQYVTSRLGSGNPRTGKRVEVNVTDLAAIAGALDVDAVELVERAIEAARKVVPFRTRDERSVPDRSLPSVAKKRRDRGENEDDHQT